MMPPTFGLTPVRWRLAFVAAACLVGCSGAERQIESGRRYVSIVYSDTTYETFGRSDRSVTGVLVEKSGDSTSFKTRNLSDERVAEVDLTLLPSARRHQPSMTRVFDIPSGTIPLLGNSVAFLEQLLRRARQRGGDRVAVPVMLVGAAASNTIFTVIFRGKDSVLVLAPDGDPRNGLHIGVNAQGQIVGVDLPLSGLKIRAAR
jgi:hypothetical protein